MLRETNNRQIEEITSLSAIYNYKEFSYSIRNVTRCYYNVLPKVEYGLLKLKTVNMYKDAGTKACSNSKNFVKYLPPVRIYIELPYDYPVKNPPKFYISTSWLSCWQISCICKKLDDIWLSNEGEEILFLWFEFLRNHLLGFLQIRDTLDISFLCSMHYNVSSYFHLNWKYQYDERAVCNMLFLDPLQFLISYDKQQRETEFKQSFHTCIICFENYSGEKCIEHENCNHVYCRTCIEEYVAVKINENSVRVITCPMSDCNSFITVNEVKQFCRNLFSKYEEKLLQVTLSGMENLIYCPQKECQFPFLKDTDNALAVCYKCDYCFCIYCYKGYHGVMPCINALNNREQLIEEYQSGDKCKKQLLVKKYGRKQIETLIEKHLTNEYLKRSAKPCPNCQTMIEKIDGCNKMRCIHCKTNFCWLCGVQITTSNPYEHFLSRTNACYKRLFEYKSE